MTILVVGVGGALGAIARYLASGWIHEATGGSFPWSTMVVNITGSAALGFVLVWLQSATTNPELRQFIAIGFLGSFTTFSTYSAEAMMLLRDGAWGRAGGYVFGSVALGLLAVAAGAALATAVTSTGRA